MAARSPVLCTRVVEAIGDLEGRDCRELEYSIYEYIDPEALDMLGNRPECEWKLEFRVDDHMVIVENDGTLTVDGQDFTWTAE